MKFNYLETELSPIGCLAQDSLSGVAELEKGLITRDYVPEEKLSYWQLVFLQSKANGCSYQGKDLPQINWQWPKNTWFQEQLRVYELIENHKNQRPQLFDFVRGEIC